PRCADHSTPARPPPTIRHSGHTSPAGEADRLLPRIQTLPAKAQTRTANTTHPNPHPERRRARPGAPGPLLPSPLPPARAPTPRNAAPEWDGPPLPLRRRLFEPRPRETPHPAGD